MHLHTCIVSYKRAELTKRTLESYRATVTIPHTLVIVDNGSPAEVVAWLQSLEVDVVLLGENRYPGYATNVGWEWAPRRTTLFQRLDNDTRLLEGWCEPMVEAFEDPEVGQYGLVAAGDEPWTSQPDWPVGGNSVIRAELYREGLRYSEEPWTASGAPFEDQQFYQEVIKRGYRRVFSPRPAIEYLDDGDFVYRRESHKARGLVATPWGS